MMKQVGKSYHLIPDEQLRWRQILAVLYQAHVLTA